MYIIKYDELSELFIMDGWAERLVGDHLETIAKEHGIEHNACSESHLLSILRNNGIDVILDFEW